MKNFLIIILLLGSLITVAPAAKKALQHLHIVGGNNPSIPVDTITEDTITKLHVKSTNVPEAVGDLFFIHFRNGANAEMTVDGSVTPVEYRIDAEVGEDLVVTSMIIHGFANGIKIDKFLNLNNELANGILIEVKSDNETFTFLPITNTQAFDAHFSFGPGRSYELIFASGNDSLVARFGPDSPFLIKKIGTYPGNEDYIKFIIRDNLTGVSSLEALVVGSRK